MTSHLPSEHVFIPTGDLSETSPLTTSTILLSSNDPIVMESPQSSQRLGPATLQPTQEIPSQNRGGCDENGQDVIVEESPQPEERRGPAPPQSTRETLSQFADATEPMDSLSISLLTWEGRRTWSSTSRLRFYRMKNILSRYPKASFFLVLSATIITVLIARQGYFTNTHPRGSHDSALLSPTVSPSYKPTLLPTPPKDERLAAVLVCASQLSGFPISHLHNDPVRWKVVEYFHHGGGMYIYPKNCSEEKSLFSVMYSMITVRESLNVANPSWNEERSYVTDLWVVCGWKRVQCGRVEENETPTVTGLFLNSADLSGTIPPEIKGLWGLEVLDLTSNPALTGALPTTLGMLRNLNQLTIHYSNLNGTVPISMGNLLKLGVFRLYRTKVTGTMPAEICSLRKRGSLNVLAADCAFVECSCCTECKHSLE